MSLHKRGLLLGTLSMACLPSIGRAVPVSRDLLCTPFDARGIQGCEVGIPLYNLPSAQQRCQNWCWAACVEAIFSFAGYHIPQEELVRTVYGDLICRPGTASDVERLMNGRWIDGGGRRFQARTSTILNVQRNQWSQFIIENVAHSLAARRPVIAFIGPSSGTVGHAVVVTALSYLQDTYGRYIVQNIIVRDPWPDSPNRRELGGDELQRLHYLSSVEVVASY